MEDLETRPAEAVDHQNVGAVLATVQCCECYWDTPVSLSQSREFQARIQEAFTLLEKQSNDGEVDEAVLDGLIAVKDDIIEAIEALRWLTIAAEKCAPRGRPWPTCWTDLDLAQYNAHRVINGDVRKIHRLDHASIAQRRREMEIELARTERARRMDRAHNCLLAVIPAVLLLLIGHSASPQATFLDWENFRLLAGLWITFAVLGYIMYRSSAKEVYVPLPPVKRN